MVKTCRALVVLLCAFSHATAMASETPLCDWLSGVGESAQALAAGDAARAEAAAQRAVDALPRGAAAARAAAALGLALHARGAYRLAAQALETALAGPATPSRAELALVRGQALLLGEDPAAAARALAEAAAADLAAGRKAAFLEGRALVASGGAKEAVPLLAKLLERYPSDPAAPAARLDLAAARRATGDAAGAVALYREVWLSADPPEADLAGEQLKAWRTAGGPVPAETWLDHAGRAERLLVDARPEDALRELDLAAADRAAPVDRLQALRASALAGQGKYADAARTAEPLVQASDPSVRRTATFILARAAARGGRVDEAVERYREVSASAAPVPGLPAWRLRELADETAYMAAWLPYDAGQYARAAAGLQAFARSHPRSRRATDALWFAAWSQLRLGKRAEALAGMRRMARGPMAPAAAYWQARLLGGTRQRKLLEQASSLGGDGWYGFLARARLDAIGAPASRPARPPSGPLPDAVDPASAARLGLAVELLALGLPDAAVDELRELAGSRQAHAAAPHLAQLAAFAGDAELPFRMARDHLGPSRRFLRWSFPSPHLDIVEPTATASGLDPALVLAVMRRESNFQRVIRSSAGAEGLLQLRPATAERLAAVLGLAPGVSERLAEPSVNLPIGIHYLGLLAARFQEPALAVAGYNAGPAAAGAWAEARKGMPLDEWVECIPFRETRTYVKVVISDWDVYRELSGEATAPIDPARPVPEPSKGVQF